MTVFMIFELVIVAMFLYLIVNLIRYFFFRESRGGSFFGLSDNWIKKQKKEEK